MRFLLVLLLLFIPLNAVAQYQPTWESLDARPVPAWYSDAKFGIFIHWGVYSVPAYAPTDVSLYAKYAEWYWKRLTDPESEGHQQFRAFHDRVFGPETSYRDLAPLFRAEMFDPEAWAELFRDAGARYVVLTSKHHDGFALWPSEYSPGWNAGDVGPRRDLAGELTRAVRDAGLKMGFYYSLYEWFNPLYHDDLKAYTDSHMWPQLRELVTEYEPDVVWGDGEWDHASADWGSEEFLAWLYNESPVRETVVVNDRWGSETRSRHGGHYTTEYLIVHDGEGIESSRAMHPWEECRGIGGSFGYNRNERLEDYSTSEELIHLLVDVVSRGGNLLLNVGPTADGRIPVIMEERLRDMGEWLRVNGEAIYGSRRWKEAPDLQQVRFTRTDDAVYAIALQWPGEELSIPIQDGAVSDVRLLGHDGAVEWSPEPTGVHIEIPSVGISDVPVRHAYVFRLALR